MTDTTESIALPESSEPTHVAFTHNQRRAITAFGIFAALTTVATVVASIQLSGTVNDFSAQLAQHIMHK